MLSILIPYAFISCIVSVDSFILEGPRSIQVKKGSSAVFRCRSSVAGAVVEWTHNGRRLSEQRIIEEDDYPYHNSKVLDDGTLVLQNVVKKSEGSYLCTVHTQTGSTVSLPATLTVLERTEKPRISHRPAKTVVKQGSKIVLDCLASGYPPPTYTWYKDGGRLSSAHNRFLLVSNGSLIIENAQYDDSAHYRCSASNYLGKASSSNRVQVESTDPESAPSITTRPRSRQTHEGGIVELTCVARGNPYPTITWWNNRRLVTATSRIKLSNGGQHFRIQDVEVYDSGRYTCVAENRLGKQQVTASITVIPDQNSIPGAGRSLASDNDVQSAVIEDVIAYSGSNFELICDQEVGGRQVTWMKDGVHISPHSPQSDLFDGGRRIRITDVSPSEAGDYTCEVAGSRTNHQIYRVTVIQTTERGDDVEEIDRSQRVEERVARSRANLVESLDFQSSGFVSSGIQNDEETRYESDLSYDVRAVNAREQVILTSIEEARRTVDRALNYTVQLLFAHQQHTRRTPHQLLRIFRYPSGTERELARAGEIYQRTLEIVESKVKEGEFYNLTTYSLENLISPANLELIGNLSGCEAHRQEFNCEDVCFHRKYRSADGTCNNWENAAHGASLIPFRRLLPPEYENGFNTPIGFGKGRLYNGYRKPNPRKISSTLLSSDQMTEDPTGTAMIMQWGQFLDHDLGHSMESVARQTFRTGETCSGSCDNEAPCFPIPVPDNDPRIGGSGGCIEFTRSAASCGSGSTSVFFEKLQPREQINQLSSFIDASQVYGSEITLALNLRNLTNEFGRLREGLTYDHGKPLLPFNDQHPIDCRRDPRESDIGCFLAGDVRANEQLGLLTMHTLFFREHNRLATSLRQLNPHWNGETIYQEARKIVGGMMQHITFKHWLPTILGEEGMAKLGSYQGYSANTDPTLSNVFSTAAFRFGHTLVPAVLHRLDQNLQPISEGNLKLHEAFFSPWRLVEEGGVDPILRGLYAKPAKLPKAREAMTEDLTEKLFQAAHAVALDLAALNIQRGRDHGLPAYSDWVKHCRGETVLSWQHVARFIKNRDILSGLSDLYGDARNIDLWVAGVLEDLVPGGRVGPTFQCLIIEQMARLREGDRFWYERPSVFSEDQRDQIKQASLARIICDSGDDIRKISPDVFRLSEEQIPCSKIPKMSLLPWKECTEEISRTSFRVTTRRRSSARPRRLRDV